MGDAEVDFSWEKLPRDSRAFRSAQEGERDSFPSRQLSLAPRTESFVARGGVKVCAMAMCADPKWRLAQERGGAAVVGPALALRLWANSEQLKDHNAFVFLDAKGNEEASRTYWSVWTQSGGVAQAMRSRWGVRTGDRVLLVYPPGIDFVVAFLACLRAGAVAVPAYPPDPKRLDNQADALHAIAKDAGAHVALTDDKYIWIARYAATYAAGNKANRWLRSLVGAEAERSYSKGGAWPDWLRWHSTHGVCGAADFEDAEVCGEDCAFLQYTSGSTSQPKGVVVTHGALCHNLYLMIRASRHSTAAFDRLRSGVPADLSTLCVDDWIPTDPGTVVSWLPQYHDMGLIVNILAPLTIPGMRSVRMSPFTFLRHPLLWAEAISKYRGSVITAPDFGYSQLVKHALAACKEGTLEMSQYDFSHVRIALNGAGMIRHKTMHDFAVLFRCAGLKEGVLGGAYGLAEHCVYVCHGGETVLSLDRNALAEGSVTLRDRSDAHALQFVSCGKVTDDVDVRIVCHDTRAELPPGCVGEIWVASPSKTAGYWNKPEETEYVFNARMSRSLHSKDAEAAYLRTGDLGFVWKGELYFVSRLKDLVVVHGRNVIPDDVELVISKSHPSVRTGCVAVFQTEEDVMCAVAEVRAGDMGDAEARDVERAIKSAVRGRCHVSLVGLHLIEPRSIPKTTSGKVRRSECRRRYLAGDFHDVLVRSDTVHAHSVKVGVQSLSHLPAHETQEAILVRLVEITKGVGLHLHPTDSMMEGGADSSLMISLHRDFERSFDCSIPFMVIMDHPNLQSVSEYITKDLLRKSGRINEIDGIGVGKVGTPERDQKKWRMEKRRNVVSMLPMAAFLLLMVVLSLRLNRTVHGYSVSYWTQSPPQFFAAQIAGWGKTFKLSDGFFGRKLDRFHDRLIVWIFELLPLHLVTGFALHAARRTHAIAKRFSQAEITIAVSLVHVFAVHGLCASWSLAAAAINYGILARVLPLAKEKPAVCRWVVWCVNLALIGLNNVFDLVHQPPSSDAGVGVLRWLVYGPVRSHLSLFTPFMTYRYLALRLLSCSLDSLDEGAVPSESDYWAYVLYGPLYLHGPCMQYRHFQDCKAGHRKRGSPLQTLQSEDSQPALKELGGMIGITLALLIAAHTFYMPTIVFLVM